MATVTITISDVRGGQVNARMECDPPIKTAHLDDVGRLTPAQREAIVALSGLLGRAQKGSVNKKVKTS